MTKADLLKHLDDCGKSIEYLLENTSVLPEFDAPDDLDNLNGMLTSLASIQNGLTDMSQWFLLYATHGAEED